MSDQLFGLFDDGPVRHKRVVPEIFKVNNIIIYQDFEGYWNNQKDMESFISCKLSSPEGVKVEKELKEWITLFVVLWLEKEMGAEKEVWKMVVEKAREWVVGSVGSEHVARMLEERVLKTL